ncbi:MAG TPA: SMP-30/gluconolactonase/LRE family protein [Bryobacteraceae bacterium]|nr:SMP-30/gluconolactonase/LRE family protein [Bryobacteraceae bacterium]
MTISAFSQDFSLIKVELLAKGYTFTEGPAWSKDGFLIFSDTPTDRLLKWEPGREPEVYRENAHGPAGNAFDSQGRLYTCETRTRRVTRTDKKGTVEVLAERFEDKRLNAPNDVVLSRTDHVYFTDPAFGSQQDHRELDFYGVYHLPPKGPLKVVARPRGRPNGIALSPTGRILYVANSDEHNVRAYDLDKNGDPTGERVLISGIDGVPDGVRVDEKGDLWVAANGIAIYSPEGKLIHHMPVHGVPSNLAFGEADLKSVFISARGNIYRARVGVKGAY